ncbi:MAG: hypothetical protein ACYS47_15730 [Planctomycetota bacterium]|jgi:hypothetical protein
MREFKGDWRDLFFGFRIALDLRKIFLSFVGLIFMLAGLFLILCLGVGLDVGKDFTNTIGDRQLLDTIYMLKVWVYGHYVEPFQKVLLDPFSAKWFFIPSVSTASEGGTWPFFVGLASVLWLVLIWSKFGGAITRIAAVEVAKDERITTHEAMDFAKKKYSSYFWSPVSVLIAFLFFFLVNAIAGVLAWIPYLGPLLVGLCSFLAFLGGFVMLLIAIGGVFGWPLMAPAVSAEGTDAFDAVSRAFSYVYSRPWQYAFYWIVSGVYGLFAVGFVWVFTLVMVNLTFQSAHLWTGRPYDPAIRAIFSFGEGAPFKGMDVATGIMTVLLGTLVVLIYGLGFSFAVSYFYSARTLMYFILRKRVDNTEMSEVYLEEEEEDLFEDDVEFGETPAKDEGGEGKEGEKKEEAEEKKAEEPASKSAEGGPEEKGKKDPSKGKKKAASKRKAASKAKKGGKGKKGKKA